MDWKEYQEKVAEIFRSMGAEVLVGHIVEGARGKHEVDVWVRLKNFGLEMIWVCECKYWKNAIPKEKVLTFYEITKDIGADRGFLFSESGFQSGAIRSTKNTNITLISLDGIVDLIGDELQEITLVKFLKQIGSIRSRLKQCWTDDLGNVRFIKEVDFDACVTIDGQLLYTSLEIQKGLNENWPVLISRFSKSRTKCENLNELNKILEIEIKKIETKVSQIQRNADVEFDKIRSLRSLFVESILDLMEFGEKLLYGTTQCFDEKALTTVGKMKKVGEIASKLKPHLGGSFSRELNKIMRILIDTIYLHLTKPNTQRSEWNTSVDIIKEQIAVLMQIEKV